MDNVHRILPDWEPQLVDAQVRYYKHFFTAEEADHYLKVFSEQIAWQQDPITVFGKTYMQPRLTALYSSNAEAYSYSGVTMHPHPMIPELTAIQQRVEKVCSTAFTSVLLNCYRDGKDSNGWHADNEKELGTNPVIASLSFGGERFFHFKHRHLKTEKHKIVLHHGSLLLMEGPMQHHWVHQIAKTARAVDSRINLTFRKIIQK